MVEPALMDKEQSSTWLEELADSIARGLAGRVSRRSFLGRVGVGAVAASLGSVGVAVTRSQTAATSRQVVYEAERVILA